MKPMLRITVIVCCLLTTLISMDVTFNAGVQASDTEEAVGKPMTSIRVAGTARKTTRRTIRQTSVIVESLPKGCSTVVVQGTSLYQCGDTYYKSRDNQYVVVTVD